MAYVFSSAADRAGIVEDIDWNCDTDATSYPLTDKARNVNRWLYRLITWKIKSTPGWSYDDKNNTVTPIAKGFLVDGQERYTHPAEMLTMQKITVLDANQNEHEVLPVTLDEYKRRTSSATRATGLPEVYLIKGNEFFFDPIPKAGSFYATNALWIYLVSTATMFQATGADAQSAGIPEPFCRVLSLGPSADYWLKYDPAKAREFFAQISEIKNEMMTFDIEQIEDIKPALRPNHNTRQYT